ncbi:MAG: epoxyqueuosine reductase QueH [Firmicutes bacterium]|nr:epoxyqueuosine reductase QueH [Bacillota bacterium]
MEKVFMHTCCAPCSVACITELRQEGIEPVSFWYNPNIHPTTEYRMRRNTLMDYAQSVGMELIRKEEYGLRRFIEGIYPEWDNRCGFCYGIRLDETARTAAEMGFHAFTTTLLISPYQKHDLIRAVGEEAARKYGLTFLYRDFRPHFREGQDKARELGLYMQKYCGCIFSEEERYAKKKKPANTEQK